VSLRNYLFDKNILKSNEFDVKTILVGNLSAGGTGKTPHIEYLIRLLKNDYKLATLSRGYGRKSHGFIESDENSTATQIGDEPLQFKTKFPEVSVNVGVKRVDSIIEIMGKESPPEIILLDDAFQHRALKAGFSILLTDYSSPFYKDFMLPTGYLREFPVGKKRANILVVTKCPDDISEEKKQEIIGRLKPTSSQKVFFSMIKYGDITYLKKSNNKLLINELSSKNILLITGIANPKPLLNYLNKNKVNVTHLKYPDHFNFSKKEIEKIVAKFQKMEGENKIILTTEKDAMRLKAFEELKSLPIYFQEIEVEIVGEKEVFDDIILNYTKR